MSKKTAPSLKSTLAIAFVTLSLIVLLVISTLQLIFYVRSQQDIVLGEQRLIAQGVANKVQNFIEKRFTELETAVKFGDLAGASSTTIQRSLNQLLGLEPAFRQLAMFDSNKQLLTRVSRLSMVNKNDITKRLKEELFTQAEQGKRYIGPVYFDEQTLEPFVIMTVPALDAIGDFHGVLVAEVNLRFMWELINQLNISQSGNGLVYVVDSDGRLLAFEDVRRVLGNEILSRLPPVAAFISQKNQPTELQKDNTVFASGINGTNVLATYVPLQMPDWAVVIEIPLLEAYQNVISNIALIGLFVLGVAALAAGVGAYLAQRLTLPLLNLTTIANRIAAGEMGAQAVVQGPAEVIQLAGAFNDMTGQLQEMFRKEEKQAAERERLQLEIIEVQKQAIQELSTPVIPIMESVIVMPLVGNIDATRAKDITRALLSGISEYRAQVVILDITGVPTVDSEVANYFNKTIQAAQLKGSQTIVTGISDAVAETMVELGIDWSKIKTLSNLDMGLVAAFDSMGVKLVK